MSYTHHLYPEAEDDLRELAKYFMEENLTVALNNEKNRDVFDWNENLLITSLLTPAQYLLLRVSWI